METLIGVVVILVAAVLAGIFIFPTKRPEGCTCKTYNNLSCGPVNDCPVHKHFME